MPLKIKKKSSMVLLDYSVASSCCESSQLCAFSVLGCLLLRLQNKYCCRNEYLGLGYVSAKQLQISLLGVNSGEHN